MSLLLDYLMPEMDGPDVLRALRDNNIAGFEEKYDNIDVLLIDDIQMLTDKNQTQQQFFKLFN